MEQGVEIPGHERNICNGIAVQGKHFELTAHSWIEGSSHSEIKIKQIQFNDYFLISFQMTDQNFDILINFQYKF